MALDTVGWVTCNCRAAAVNPPVRLMARKYFRCWRFIENVYG
jgi:hypothetical protein